MLLAAPWAHGTCSVVAGINALFGSVTSIAARTTSQQTSTSQAGLRCSGTLLSVLQPGDHFYATIVSANAGLKGTSGDVLPYTLYGDSTTSYPIATGTAYDYASTPLINLLGLLGGTPANLPLYFRTATGSNLAAGTYTDTLTINWSWNYCSGIGLAGICIGRDIGSGTSSFTATLSVTNDCTITAPAIAFGAAPIVSGFAPISGALSMVCTKGMSYTVGLGPGLNAASNGRRQMASSGSWLQYDIFRSDGAVWNDSSARVASSTVADGLTAQTYSFTARIYADQTTPAAGSYTDSVVVDVHF